MNLKRYSLTGLILCSILSINSIAFAQQSSKLPYKNPSLSTEARVKDLLQRMTLDEKIAQMRHLHSENYNSGQRVSLEKVKSFTGGLSFGCVEAVPFSISEYAKGIFTLQKHMRENTRLGIPILPVTEALHGIVHNGATIYPQAIAIGATFNPLMVSRMVDQIGKGMSQVGIKQVLSPDLDLARELRWGRVEETYGEDPFLVAEMGKAYVIGLRKHNMVCTPKHFIGHGSPLGGLNLASVEGGKRQLLSLYLEPFQKVIEAGNPLSIMNCYSSYDGEPIASSSAMLTDLLRKTLGFKGYVYSDWGIVSMLYNFHHTANGPSDAAKQSVEAGIDLEAGGTEFEKLKAMVERKQMDVKYIDAAVSHILYTKFKSGLFEDPLIDTTKTIQLRTPETIQLAKEMADESTVLLKNNGILPLQLAKVKSLAVIGPNADQVQFGDYTWTRSNKAGITPLKGLTDKLGAKVDINYVKGCDLVSSDSTGFAAAVAAAAKSDVAVIFVGSQSPALGREAANSTAGEGYDLSDLKLPGVQEELIKAVRLAGKPVVVVLVTGKPFALPWVKQNADAVITQWYAGEQQGNSIADILLGNVNPSGKLPVSFPQSVGHLPVYYNYLPSDKGYYRVPGSPEKPGRDYVFSNPDALWSFGYGLSYTKFSMSNFTVSKNNYALKDTIAIKLDITNNGDVFGKEVVQVYIRDVVSSVATPIKALKAFQKVGLDPSQSKQVTLKIPVQELFLINKDYQRVVEAGEFEIQVGSSSDHILWKKIVNVGVDKSVKDIETKKTVSKTVAPTAQSNQGKSVTVTGEVRDVQASILAGIKVSVKNTNNTVFTNSQGIYTIKAKIGDVLVFSAKGFETKEIVVGSDLSINIKLKSA